MRWSVLISSFFRVNITQISFLIRFTFISLNRWWIHLRVRNTNVLYVVVSNILWFYSILAFENIIIFISRITKFIKFIYLFFVFVTRHLSVLFYPFEIIKGTVIIKSIVLRTVLGSAIKCFTKFELRNSCWVTNTRITDWWSLFFEIRLSGIIRAVVRSDCFFARLRSSVREGFRSLKVLLLIKRTAIF